MTTDPSPSGQVVGGTLPNRDGSAVPPSIAAVSQLIPSSDGGAAIEVGEHATMPPAQRSPKPRQRMRRDARRRQLLDVAGELLATEGPESLTMERLSEAARVSKPVVYSHFDNRTSLMLAIFEDYWASVDEARSRRREESGRSFEETLAGVVAAYFDAIAERGAVLRTVLGERSIEPEVEAARQRRQQRLRDQWTQTMVAMGLEKEVAEPFAAIMIRAIEGATAYWVETGADRSAVERVYTTTVLSALRSLRRSSPLTATR